MSDLFGIHIVGFPTRWLICSCTYFYLFSGILDDEDDAETLINVNMIDAEKALRNVENRKKKPDYNPYDDAEEDEYGMVGMPNMGHLTVYLNGEKGFCIWKISLSEVRLMYHLSITI